MVCIGGLATTNCHFTRRKPLWPISLLLFPDLFEVPPRLDYGQAYLKLLKPNERERYVNNNVGVCVYILHNWRSNI